MKLERGSTESKIRRDMQMTMDSWLQAVIQSRVHVFIEYWNKDVYACALQVCCLFGYLCVSGLVSLVHVCVCVRAPTLLCICMCIVMCVFYGPCVLVCVGCCAQCELLGVSGSCPSSLLCSLRSLLLASLSSPVQLCCSMLCAQITFTILFYSILLLRMTNWSTCKGLCQCTFSVFYDTDNNVWLWPVWNSKLDCWRIKLQS